MAEDIKGLIEKIQEEGIRKAEKDAESIRRRAEEQARQTIEQAKEEAGRILENAKQDVQRFKESGEATLQQAGRDLLLSLRKKINELLLTISDQDIRDSLSGDALVKIIESVVKAGAIESGAEIIVSLKEHDRQRIEKHYMDKLAKALKQKITLQSADELQGGFTISFDGGKSQYDFSNDALAQFLAGCLKPRLAQLLQKASA